MAESMVPTSAQQVKFCTTDKCSDMYHAAIRAAVADSGKKNLALAQCKALGGMGGFAKAFCAKDSNGAFCPYAGWSQTIDNLPAHKMLDSMDGNKAAPTQADMTLMCSECQMKTGPAWIQAMMNMGDDPAVSHPNDWTPSMEQQMKDMVSRMNAVACTKGSTGFEDSGHFCLPDLKDTFGGLSGNMAKPAENPYCSTKKGCPKKIALALVDVLSAHMPDPNGKKQMQGMKKILDFSCLINPTHTPPKVPAAATIDLSTRAEGS
jgi:hypothetical protein